MHILRTFNQKSSQAICACIYMCSFYIKAMRIGLISTCRLIYFLYRVYRDKNIQISIKGKALCLCLKVLVRGKKRLYLSYVLFAKKFLAKFPQLFSLILKVHNLKRISHAIIYLGSNHLIHFFGGVLCIFIFFWTNFLFRLLRITIYFFFQYSIRHNDS